MEQQLGLSENQKVQVSVDNDGFNAKNDESPGKKKKESEIKSRPSTSTENGM